MVLILLMQAGMYLSLRDIVCGERKYSWDRIFQDAILRHRSEQLANSFSQRLCKFNQARMNCRWHSGWVSKRPGGDLSVATTTCHVHQTQSPELIFPQSSPQAAMPAATTPYFQGISCKENEILQQAEQPTKSGLGSLCTLMRMGELLFNTRETKGHKDKSGKAHTAFAPDTNRKAQMGAVTGGPARSLPTSYHDYSTAESGVE
jgi:hypothetical protein